MENLVGVGVPIPGDERLVSEQVLQLAVVPPDPRPPDLEGQPGSSASGPCSTSQADDAPLHTGGQQVHLAHLARVAIAHLRVSRRRSASSRRGRSRRPRRAGVARRRTQHDRGIGRELFAGAASWKRTREHRVDRDPVAIELEDDELAAAPDPLHPLADSAPELGRGSAHREWRRGLRAVDRAVREGGVEGVGDDRRGREARARTAIVVARGCVLDSRRPFGAEQQNSAPRPFELEGADRGPTIHGPLDRQTGRPERCSGRSFPREHAWTGGPRIDRREAGRDRAPAEATASAPTGAREDRRRRSRRRRARRDRADQRQGDDRSDRAPAET